MLTYTYSAVTGQFVIQDRESMQSDEFGPEAAESNINTVIAIQLTRIYDVLMLTLHNLDPEAAQKLTDLHEQGEFLNPAPAIVIEEDSG